MGRTRAQYNKESKKDSKSLIVDNEQIKDKKTLIPDEPQPAKDQACERAAVKRLIAVDGCRRKRLARPYPHLSRLSVAGGCHNLFAICMVHCREIVVKSGSF